VLESGSVSYGKATPYLPLIDLVKAYCGIQERDDPRAIRERVAGKLRMLDRALEPLLTPLLALLDVPADDAAWETLEPPQRRQRTLEAIKRLLLRESQVQPLGLIVEDLHWIDSETQAVLDSLVESLPAARILLLVNYRPEYAHRWGSKTYYTQLRLDPLPPDSAEALLDALAGSDSALRPLKQLLAARTEGNPLFLEESVRTLVETQVLAGERGAYRLAQALPGIQVPATVQAVLAARIDRLAAEDKRLLQTAAVIGKDVPLSVLQAIAEVPEDVLRHRLATLQASEFLHEARFFPDVEYTFKHALIRDVAYQNLLIQRRKALHCAVGQAIETLSSERVAEHYEELAHHFTEGEKWGKAVEYSLLAARRAQHSFANEEARVHYARALNAARQLTPAADARFLAGLHEGHAAVLVELAHYEIAVAEYHRVLDLVRPSGDRSREASILAALFRAHHRNHRPESGIDCNEQALAIARELGDQTVEAKCLLNRAIFHAAWYGKVDEAIQDADRALDLARGMDDRRLLAEAITMLGQGREFRGDLRQSLVHLKEGANLAEAEHLPIARAMFFGVIAQAALGEYEEALRWYRRLHDYAFDAGDKFWAARTPNLAGGIHLELFDLDEAIRLNLEAHEVARTLWRWAEPRAHCLLNAGLAHLERADLGAAAAFFDRAWALLDEDGFLQWRWHIPLLRARGELALAEGRFDDAWSFATQSLDMATRTSSLKHIARAQRLQGEILAVTGRSEAAQESLRASVALAESLGTPREMWMGQAALGRVFARLGRDRDAEESLAEARQTIETIADKLTTPSLRLSFLRAEPVIDVYRMLGRRPPLPGPP
jgi:predicted ATPase